MKNPWDICVVHHSHTDIGYTDLQEKIIHTQVDFIRCAVSIILDGYERDTPERDFKWNCETYFCVERFLAESSEDERNNFFECVKRGNIGISASYLNFSDLVDIDILNRRTREMVEIFAGRDIQVHSAMNADVNGISLGMRDVFAEQGIDFFFTNIHCHHGMYPLYRNQTPYYWTHGKHGRHGGDKRILVWNGEHYHLGNVFGLVEEAHTNFITENYVGTAGGTDTGADAGADSVSHRKDAHIASIKAKFDAYIGQLLDSDYPYRFFPIGVSGVFSDNGPPNPDIIHTIGAFNERFGDEMRLRMVTLDELGEAVKQNLKRTVESGASEGPVQGPLQVPEYSGDLNDWWAHGVASTPYAVKHYREARRIYHLCRALDPDDTFTDTDIRREAEDNLLLFAEHTWGHSSTIGDPFSTIVNSLDIRNISYASKAHESSNVNFLKISHNRGDIMRYYSRSGRIKAIHTGSETARCMASFYIEAYGYQGVRLIREKTQEEIPTQSSDHPRGILINFIDTFAPNEEKTYRFQEVPRRPKVQNTRVAYIGSERVQDIVNDYDPLTFRLPHTLENDFFRIEYRIPEGVISFYDKRADREMLRGGDNRFFTPIYERTEIRTDPYEERRLLGRNIRGLHAEKHLARLEDVKVLEQGSLFTSVELRWSLPGTTHSAVRIRLYHAMPRIDFTYRVAKTINEEPESLYLPLSLNIPGAVRYFDKGGVPFRPGIDQIPGSCMEYYLVDTGVVYEAPDCSMLIQLRDVPMVYMGPLRHHPILLCDNAPENNRRDIHSWVMNNIWETNFKMDLSGFGEFSYTLERMEKTSAAESFKAMKSSDSVLAFMTE